MKSKFTFSKIFSTLLLAGFALWAESAEAQSISVTSSPTTTSFEGWAGIMPTGYEFSGTGTAFTGSTPYKGTGASDNAGGLYSVSGFGFGYQPAGSASFLTVTGTYTNNTGGTISSLTISYDAFVIYDRASRNPLWEVYLNGTQISDLTWSSVDSVSPMNLSFTISGISIPDGVDFTISLESDRGSGSGSSPKIGFDNVSIAYTLASVATIEMLGASTDSICFSDEFSLTYDASGFDPEETFRLEVAEGSDPTTFYYLKSTSDPSTITVSTDLLDAVISEHEELIFRIVSETDEVISNNEISLFYILPIAVAMNSFTHTYPYNGAIGKTLVNPSNCSEYFGFLYSDDDLGNINLDLNVDAAFDYNGKPLLGRYFDLSTDNTGDITSFNVYIPASEIAEYNATSDIMIGRYKAIDEVNGDNLLLYFYPGAASAGTTGPKGMYDSTGYEVLEPTSIEYDPDLDAFSYHFTISADGGFFFGTARPEQFIEITGASVDSFCYGDMFNIEFIADGFPSGESFILEITNDFPTYHPVMSTTVPGVFSVSTDDLGEFKFENYVSFRIINSDATVESFNLIELSSRKSYTPASSSFSDTRTVDDDVIYFNNPADCSEISLTLSSSDDLGLVQADMNMGAHFTYNNRPLFGRNYDISTSNTPTVPATLKIYIPASEIVDFNTLPEVVSEHYAEIDEVTGEGLQLLVFHGAPTDGTDGPGGLYDTTGSELLNPIAFSFNVDVDAFEYEFLVSNFSGFFPTSPVGPLPLRLGNLSAHKGNGENIIRFESLSETKDYSFVVEKSQDGRSFSILEVIPAKGTPSKYMARDQQPKGTNFYRIKMVNNVSGHFVYSRIVKLTTDKEEVQIKVFPNPADAYINIDIQGKITADANIAIFDVTGKLVYEQNVSESGTIQLSTDQLNSGVYQVLYKDGVQVQNIPLVIK